MQSTYYPLFSVYLKHNYFSGNNLECVDVSPTPNCIYQCNRYGLLFKRFKSGFTILYDSLWTGRERDRLQLLDDTTLRFYMTLHDDHFYNYTSGFQKNLMNSLFYFSNAAQPESPFLHHAGGVTGEDLVLKEKINQDFFVKPFGVIDIKLSKDLQQNYTIQFSRNKTYWRYHLVSDHLKMINNPAILRGKDYFFEGPVATTLPDHREVLTFVSREPIELSELQNETNQLVENFDPGSTKHKVVMRALPTPDIRSISRLNNANKDAFTYSEIFI